MLQLDPTQFRYIKPLSWDEVFNIWRGNEAANPKWIEHYTSKGFKTWDDWRRATHAALKPEELEWHLCEIIDHLKTVPRFRGGPFKSWKRVYFRELDPPPTFDELFSKRPEIATNVPVIEVLKNFPKHTTISGVQVKEDIYVVEGMHRSCALTMAAREGKKIETELTLALAHYPGEGMPTLGLG